MDFAEAAGRVLAGEPSVWAPEYPPGPQERAFAEFGLGAHGQGGWDDASIDRRLDSLRQWVSFVADRDSPNAVFMDTTTLYAAWELVRGKDPASKLTHATLFDLSTFVTNVVLYDQVFCLENPYVDPFAINEALGNQPVVVPLPVRDDHGGADTSSGVTAVLASLFDEVLGYGSQLARLRLEDPARGDAVAIQLGWEAILGWPITVAEALGLERVHSESDRWSSSGPALVTELLRAVSTKSEQNATELPVHGTWFQRDAAEFVSECNHRGMFNLRVAELLGLPYSPNVARLPFRAHLHAQNRVATERLLTLELMEREFAHQRASYLIGSGPEMQLPVVLSALLARVGSLDGFFDELAELRLLAEPLRRHRAELDDAIRRRDREVIDRLRAAAQDDASDLGKALRVPTVGLAASVLPALGGPLAPLLLTGLAALVTFFSESREVLTRRLLRPQEWVLTDVASLAAAVGEEIDRVGGLWGIGPGRAQQIAERFARLGTLGAA